jgi:hypothetical protein
MLWIPLFWGIVLRQWVIGFSGFKTILPQNFRNQLPSDVVSHPGRMESPATPLQRHGVFDILCMFIVKSYTKDFTNVHLLW